MSVLQELLAAMDGGQYHLMWGDDDASHVKIDIADRYDALQGLNRVISSEMEVEELCVP